jgi:hypothetical protein
MWSTLLSNAASPRTHIYCARHYHCFRAALPCSTFRLRVCLLYLKTNAVVCLQFLRRWHQSSIAGSRSARRARIQAYGESLQSYSDDLLPPLTCEHGFRIGCS